MSNTGLIARKGASKRSKCKSRIVNAPRPKIALESALRANLEKACLCLGSALKTAPHPYLDGVLCRSDGAIFVPANGPRPGHLTYGHKMLNGYRDVVIRGVHYYVHRLVAEAFHGLCPPDKCEIDHANRRKDDNRPENLRWVTRSQNQRNRPICDASLAKYGVSQVNDKKGYTKAYREYHRDNDPAYREKHNAYKRTRYATDPKFRAQRKAASERWRLKKKAKEAE